MPGSLTRAFLLCINLPAEFALISINSQQNILKRR